MTNPFQKTLEKRKQQKEAEELNDGQSWQFDKDDTQWLGLVDGKDIPFRILGSPAEARQKPTDAKFVQWSQVLTDTGKSHIHVYWPQVVEYDGYETGNVDKTWILWKVYADIIEGDWEEVEPGQGQFGKKRNFNKKFNHQGHPLLERVQRNRKPNQPFDVSFKPRHRVVLPVIERLTDWCVTNKHGKVLTAKRSFWKNDKEGQPIYFTDPGISITTYNAILDGIVEKVGPWWDYDMVVTKNTASKSDIVKCIKDTSISEEATNAGVDGPLTEEEKTYELYDLDKKYQYTSYTKLFRACKKLFSEWDAYTAQSSVPTKYYEELLDLVKIEKEANDKKKKEAAATSTQVDGIKDKPNTPSTTSARADSSQPNTSQPPKSVEESTPGKDLDDEIPFSADPPPAPAFGERPARQVKGVGAPMDKQCLTNFASWAIIPKDDQDETAGCIERFEGKVPVYKPEDPRGAKVQLFPCDKEDCTFDGTVRTKLPGTVYHCPVCGTAFAIDG